MAAVGGGGEARGVAAGAPARAPRHATRARAQADQKPSPRAPRAPKPAPGGSVRTPFAIPRPGRAPAKCADDRKPQTVRGGNTANAPPPRERERERARVFFLARFCSHSMNQIQNCARFFFFWLPAGRCAGGSRGWGSGAALRSGAAAGSRRVARRRPRTDPASIDRSNRTRPTPTSERGRHPL